MNIGIPTEIKTLESRIALTPDACAELVDGGHAVHVQAGAGEGSGFPDARYRRAGASIQAGAAALYGASDLVVKVKEPQAGDLAYLRPDHLLFCYLHLAAEPELASALRELGLTALGFETLVDERGGLPLLQPMSEIAGRLAVQIGTRLLHAPEGGRGVLLGGVAGAERGHVVVFGAGNAGGASVELAAAVGARVTVFDKQPAALHRMQKVGAQVQALYPHGEVVDIALGDADLLIGAVLSPGARAPVVVSAEQVSRMRQGSVIMDIAIDQGGCIATSRPTTYADPTFVEHGVTHFCVTNMPGAVPRTASIALSGALLPWVVRLAGHDWRAHRELSGAINVSAGECLVGV